MDARKKRQKTKLVAFIWWCGDEECFCHQARIEKHVPNFKRLGLLNLHDTEILWESEFITEATQKDLDDLRFQLRLEASKYGIETNDHGYGDQEEL